MIFTVYSSLTGEEYKFEGTLEEAAAHLVAKRPVMHHRFVLSDADGNELGSMHIDENWFTYGMAKNEIVRHHILAAGINFKREAK